MSDEVEKLDSNAEIPVRYEVEENVIEVDKVNRIARRLLLSQTKKLRKKYKHLKGKKDDQGRSATIVIRMPKKGSLSLECVIEYPEGFSSEIDGSEKAVRVS